uniref:Transient receptor potential cation channel subfamily V member 6 n=1 Tax=Phallusia mammillata TaxID=59560 RepID=A0A6F9DV08_9ASCI|nr:transient receptor potential cation channel subfamily V member 6 [Phallusia mammillata]
MGHVFAKVIPQNDESMGASSNIKAQAYGTNDIFKLVQPPTSAKTNGKGILVDEAAKAYKTKDIDRLRDVIREQLQGYLYNNGNGKHIPLKEIVERRSQSRASLSSLGLGFNYTGTGTRFCCWDINKRGPLGETVLHICFLNNYYLHNFLAKEMINVFPNLLHDIYQGDEYYGENCVHMAVANEDMDMLQFMLKQQEVLKETVPLNLQERCCGSFFSTVDQKGTRRDHTDSEIFAIDPRTNYKGLLYWGEYPLSFAACANQINAFRMLLDKGADLTAADTNGNNVLHLMVIHNNKEMFNFAYRHTTVDGDRKVVEVGKLILEQRNLQNLTPLTLAAKLANKEMLDHILELKRQVEWEFGAVTCAKYPLADVDTIDPKDGSIDPESALSIILNQKSRTHLEMLDGLLFQLLHEKWKQYGKLKFYVNGLVFFIYFFAFVASIFMQPTPVYVTNNSTNVRTLVDTCYLIKATDGQQIARFVLELLVYVMAIGYVVVAIYDIYKEKIFSFLSTMYTAPMNASFYISLLFVLALLPCRLTCAVEAEAVLLTIAICTCIPHWLFYCRGFKVVGPFIIAIYNMVIGDLLRFLVIYCIFLIGFSQAMYVIFRGVNHELFSNPGLSILGMFVITLGEFGDLYEDFDRAGNPNAAKTLFVFYMVLATVLLINVLIAMMGYTFNVIAETRWEWQRQWARIVLIMERSVPKEKRRQKQSRYSQPGEGSDERWFVVRNFKSTPKK